MSLFREDLNLWHTPSHSLCILRHSSEFSRCWRMPDISHPLEVTSLWERESDIYIYGCVYIYICVLFFVVLLTFLSLGSVVLTLQQIQWSYTLVMSSSSTSPRGQVSLATSTTSPVGPQQFSCERTECLVSSQTKLWLDNKWTKEVV